MPVRKYLVVKVRDGAVTTITQGVGELQFEEDEEDQFYMKDLRTGMFWQIFHVKLVLFILLKL